MTAAALARLTIGLAASAAAITAFLALGGWSWAGVTALVTLFVAGSILAEMAFRRLASPEEQRADLEERVRNPPD